MSPPPPPPPKPYFLLLILLLVLSVSAVFLLSPHTPSFPSPSLPSPPHRNFSLTIKLLTFNRPASLRRCLNSLSSAIYSSHHHRVHLHIFIDHFDSNQNHSISDLDSKLRISREMLELADGVRWKYGDKIVHYRSVNVGLQGQWIEAWWPASGDDDDDDEFVFVVEDDVEVSPMYYKFIEKLIVKYYYYYYEKEEFRDLIYGASLQRPRFVPGKHGNKMNLDSEGRLFLYQLVGTWGQLLFPKPWKEFRLWYDEHKAKGMKPYLDGMVTTGWYKKMGEKIWTPWFIKFIHSRGYFNIYTNFHHERALSVSHRDAGVNYGRSAGPDSHLLDESSLDFNLLEMQPLNSLKWYDFCFREVVPRRVITKLDELGHIFSSMQKEKPVLLVNISKTSEAVTRNLLCHFEGLNIRNYILMGPSSKFLIDLARRGHPVVDVGDLYEDIRLFSRLKIQPSDMILVKEIVVMAFILRKCLESGFDSWVLNSNMLVSNSYPVLGFVDQRHDIYISETSGLFIVRSTTSTMKIWDDNFLSQVAKTAGSLTHRQPSKDDQANFVFVVSKELEKQGAKYKSVDGSGSILQLGSADANKWSSGDMKIIFWFSETGFELIRKSLEELGLWIVDADYSCRAVVCHGS